MRIVNGSEPIRCHKADLVEKDACKLEALLAKEETCIRLAAFALNRSVAYVHSIVKQFPDKFSLIRIQGSVGSACIALAGDRPIQLDLVEQSEETR